MRSLFALLLVACNAPEPPGGVDARPDAGQDSGVHADAEIEDSGEVPDSGEPIDVGVDAGFPDSGASLCDDLPEPEVTPIVGARAAVDVAFDSEGNLVGSDLNAVLKSRRNGDVHVFVPIANRAGLKYLPSGDLVVVDDFEGTLIRVSPEGAQEVISPGYFFGLTVDLDGNVWAADHQQITRIDPIAKTSTVVVPLNGVPSPRSLTFDATYRTLYVGTAENTTIYKIPIDESGRAGRAEAWGSLPFSDFALVDGLGVDECGNVYVAEYVTHALYRLDREGRGRLLVQWNDTDYGHGLEWGSGIDGWDERALYLPQPYNDNTVVEVKIGVASKPRAYP